MTKGQELTTVEDLQNLPDGAVFLVQSGDERVTGEVLQVFITSYTRYRDFSGARFSSSWERSLIPAQLLHVPGVE